MRSIASLLVLLTPLPAQTDLFVGGGGFLTIAEAAAQAQDGDRIILRDDCVLTSFNVPSVDIPLGITIQSDRPGIKRSIRLGTLSPTVLFLGRFDQPVVVQDIEFGLTAWDCSVGLACLGFISVRGSTVRFQRVTVRDQLMGVNDLTSDTLLTVQSPGRVSMSRVDVLAPSFPGVYSTLFARAAAYNAIEVAAGELLAQDCRFLGGDAPDSADIGSTAGGFGMRVLAPNVVLTRCEIIDGDGAIERWSWPSRPTTYTAGGESAVVGDVFAHATRWYRGRNGAEVGPRSRIDLGLPEALLELTGGQLGGSISLRLSMPTQPPWRFPIGCVVGFDTMHVASPFGRLALRPDFVFGPSTFVGGAVQWSVPVNLSLRGMLVGAQVVLDNFELGPVAWTVVHE